MVNLGQFGQLLTGNCAHNPSFHTCPQSAVLSLIISDQHDGFSCAFTQCLVEDGYGVTAITLLPSVLEHNTKSKELP
jgi:hypothetical protein